MYIWASIFGISLCALIYCELIADYIKLSKCSWPALPNSHTNQLHAIILSDTHLLGPYHGHWLDKLYREWHMHRAFQAAIALHQPDVVFILGDLFDEGDMVDHEKFDEYVARFQRHFHTPPNVPIISAAGNHDIGFHYKLSPFFSNRFQAAFTNTGVQLYAMKDVNFVVINSMAMENDGCEFCVRALKELRKVNATLANTKPYSQPIVMQHFPSYRTSNAVCKERDDSLPITPLRENFHVLSKRSTAMLGTYLQPRLMFAGHDHFYCMSINQLGVEEYTVPSFSWRNNVNPSFMLATVSPGEHKVFRCDMLQQSSVYNIYAICGTLCLAIMIAGVMQQLCWLKNKKIK